jgi:hypothetical protein
MSCTEFDPLSSFEPFGYELSDYANKAFECADVKRFGINIRFWLEQGVLPYVEKYHGLPTVTPADLDAAKKRRRPGELEHRIDRLVSAAIGVGARDLQAMHQLRVFGNKSNHGQPEYFERARSNARQIRDWLLREYAPAASRPNHWADPAPVAPPSTPTPEPLTPGPQPVPRTQPQPSYTSYPRDGLGPRQTRLSEGTFPIKTFVALLIVGFFIWGTYSVVVAIGNWWAGLPSLTQVVAKIPKPNWSEPTTRSVAERIQPLQPPAPPRTVPQQQPPLPQIAPAPPPIVQLECPPGTLYNSYTSQCTFTPPTDPVSAGPALSIHPECPPGSTYSDQTATCVIVEADNECPSGTYMKEGSQRCVSKRKYGFFRYEEQHTLLANTFVQAPPVEESYAINVLGGSLRIYYLEIQRVRVMSCVVAVRNTSTTTPFCPASYVRLRSLRTVCSDCPDG